MFNGSNCDRKSQLSGILTEPLNPRDCTLMSTTMTSQTLQVFVYLFKMYIKPRF